MERIKSRRNNLRQVEVDQNKDEFKELFKEVHWMKKNAQRELSQGLEDEDILVWDTERHQEPGNPGSRSNPIQGALSMPSLGGFVA